MLAYFDCFSGISGDMTLGALVDLGVPVAWLKDQLGRIPLTGFDLSVTSVSRGGIHAKSLQVHTGHESESRNYAVIRSLLRESPLTSKVKASSLDMFARIAVAEAAIHGCSVDEVHFHEVGGVDAIVDIVGTALGMEYLGITKVVASSIPLGTGFVRCRHGKLPVPVPATLAILRGIPTYGTEVAHELVTPTGAAIIASLADAFGVIPEIVVDKTGYGAGTRDLETLPNVLRVIVGRSSDGETEYLKDRVTIVETCIDDMNPEVFGFVMDRLFADGALDVYWIPVFMKKNRPGTMVKVLCPENRREAVIRRILSETTSLGVRYYDAARRMLPRDSIRVQTTYGEVRVKRIMETDGGVRMVPEYEVCRQIALEKNIPIRIVYDTIMREAAGSKPTIP